VGYYRPYTTQKTNKENTLMKNKTHNIAQFLQFLLGLGIFIAAPTLGYTLTGQASWVKLMGEFALYWTIIFLIGKGIIFVFLKLFMKYKNFRAFSVLLVTTDWWFYTENFTNGVDFAITLAEAHLAALEEKKRTEQLSSVLTGKLDKEVEEMKKTLCIYKTMLENPAKGIELSLKRLEEQTR